MLVLNLLSPKKKKNVSKFISLCYARVAVSLALIFMCVLTIIVLLVMLAVQNNFNWTMRQFLITKEYNDTKQNALALNKNMEKILNIQKNFIPWAPKLAEISNIAPIDIEFTSLELNRSNQTAVISGHSQTRESLLAYKKELEKLDFINSADFPLEDALRPRDINFTINVKLKLPR